MGVRSRTGRRRLSSGKRQSRTLNALKWGIVLLPVAFISLILFSAFYGAFTSVGSSHDAEAILGSLVALLAVAGFVTCSTTALQSLYLSQDLPFLLTLPLPLGAIYGGKMFDAMAGALPTGYVMVLLLTAFGVTQSGGLLYYGVALVCFVLTTFASTSTSVLFVAAVTRYVPPKRARFVVVVGSLIILLGIFSLWGVLLPKATFDSNGSPRFEAGSAGELVAATPAGWAAHALMAAAAFELSAVAIAGSAFTGAVALCSFLAYRTFAGSFTIGYGRVRGMPAARPRRPFASLSARLIFWLPQNLGGIVLKEWLVIFRDLRRLSGAIWPLGMVAVYTIAISRQNSGGSSGDLRFWMTNAPLVLLPWGASLGISIYSFGTEGRNLELLRVAPIRPRGILFAKILAAFVPVFAVSETATLIVSVFRGAPLELYLGLAAIVAWASAGYVLIDCSASALAPVFDADHVQRSTSLPGRVVDIFAGAAFGVFSAVAIGRIILFTTEPPSTLHDVLAWQVSGVAPLGWPLVATCFLISVCVVAILVLWTSRSVATLVREGA